jgi:hypothetical protein
METRTLSLTLPAELADKLEQALQADHVRLEDIAIGWLFFGRGISEPGAPRLASVVIPASPPPAPRGVDLTAVRMEALAAATGLGLRLRGYSSVLVPLALQVPRYPREGNRTSRPFLKGT